MTPERKERIQAALSSCDPERRWKTDKLAEGAVVVDNGHFFVALDKEEFAELGVELADLVDDRVEKLAKQLAADCRVNEQAEMVGEMPAGVDGDAFVYRFKMGWKFPVRKLFSVLMGSGRTTAVSYAGGFLLVSRDEHGRLIAAAMSLGRYEQADIDGLMQLAAGDE